MAAGGGTAAYFALRDTNKPPRAGLSITPSGAGMQRLTVYSFSGSPSTDPDGDRLIYSWDFGDGRAGTGESVSHTYDSSGAFTVTLTVDDGKEQATTTGSVSQAHS